MKLLLTGAFTYSDNQINEILALGYDITFVQDERVPLEIDVSDFEVVVCNSLFLYNDITKFTKLRAIQLTSAGIDRVPLDFVDLKDIKIFNAKGVYSVPMAEWVVLKILEIYKKSKVFFKNQSEHKWVKQRDLLELTDKTVLVVGFGSVGQEVAKRLKAFGVKIIGVDSRPVKSMLLDDFYLVTDIEKVLDKSDIIVLTLPLTSETKYLIDEYKINLMPEESILINVSRGGIINECALVKALEASKFLGVALDVFEQEPLGDSPLWDFDNVHITPHISYVSERINGKLFEIITRNLRSYRGLER